MASHNKGPANKERNRIARQMINFMVENGIRIDDEPIQAAAGFAVAMFGNGYEGSTKMLARKIINFWVQRPANVPEEFHHIIEARCEHYLIDPHYARKTSAE